MGNLAQSDWADDPCKGRRGHSPCGGTNWGCRCPDKPTPEYELEETQHKIAMLQLHEAKLIEQIINDQGS
jgi:hypothetical protein